MARNHTRESLQTDEDPPLLSSIACASPARGCIDLELADAEHGFCDPFLSTMPSTPPAGVGSRVSGGRVSLMGCRSLTSLLYRQLIAGLFRLSVLRIVCLAQSPNEQTDPLIDQSAVVLAMGLLGSRFSAPLDIDAR